MKKQEKFVHKFMRFTDKLRFIFGPADRSYDDGYTPAATDKQLKEKEAEKKKSDD